MTSERQFQLDQLIDVAIASFDIPDTMYELAVRRYEDVGFWLSRCAEQRGTTGEVYPQGSFRLGTVVRPIGPKDQYDIDMVYRRDVGKASISQAKLKADAGTDLQKYVVRGPEGSPNLEQGKRCWTLIYVSEPFHIDVLPAIPDPDGIRDSILLTDVNLREWQHANPIGYSQWFRGRMTEEFMRLRKEAAVTMAKMDVEDVPDWRVKKTTLQRTVQALKRHRDIYFQHRAEYRPTSIIITTLAARSYRGAGALYNVLVKVTEDMPRHIEYPYGVPWIANPVQPEENFADRWRGDPILRTSFFEWIERAHADFNNLGSKPGVDRSIDIIAKSLGEGAAKAAGANMGQQFTVASRMGRLGLASPTGLLSASPRRAAPRHTFHGGETMPRVP